jgi:competence protein ComEA
MRYFSIGQQKILFGLALFILALLFYKFYYPALTSSREKPVREFVIEVSGEVRKPGIYIFLRPPTLKEAIEKAAGLREEGLFDEKNLSETLETGTLVHVMKESREVINVKLGRMEARKLIVFSLPLDLNRASVEDLCLVPGIGDPLGREIVAYRERRRAFRSVEELQNVKGIGGSKFQSIKTYFIVKQKERDKNIPPIE